MTTQLEQTSAEVARLKTEAERLRKQATDAEAEATRIAKEAEVHEQHLKAFRQWEREIREDITCILNAIAKAREEGSETREVMLCNRNEEVHVWATRGYRNMFREIELAHGVEITLKHTPSYGNNWGESYPETKAIIRMQPSASTHLEESYIGVLNELTQQIADSHPKQQRRRRVRGQRRREAALARAAETTT